MAKVLQNFLIGVGLDTEQYDKGAKNVESSLSRMRTLVGFTGAAITGAFAGVAGAAIAAGGRVDRLGLSLEKLNTSPEWVNAYGHAIAAMGGDFDDAAAAINAAENALDQFRLKGDFGSFQEAAFAGMREELNALTQARSGDEFMRILADVVPRMDKGQQRLIQEAWGFSDGVMRSLRAGSQELDSAVARAAMLYGEFGRATEAAREYNRTLAELNTQFEGIGETLAEKMLPAFTGVLQSTSDFISENRGTIDRLLDHAGENPAATAAVTGGAAAAATGAGLRMIGLRGVGKGLMRLGPYGMVAGGGLIAADAIVGAGVDEGEKGTASTQGMMTEYQAAPVDGFSHFDVAPQSAAPIEPTYGDFLPLGQDNYHDGYRPEQIVESPTSGFITPYEGIYGGGEVSVSEAANASPDVITIRDQRQRADEPVTPPRINVENHLDLNVEMDGRAIDARVIDVIERRERDTIDDIYSSVDR